MTVPDDLQAIGVIALMALVTYLVRILGHFIMSRVPPTAFLRAALEALPGSIMIATVVPLAARAGASGWIGLTFAVVTMMLVRREAAALVAGLAGVIAARAAGLP